MTDHTGTLVPFNYGDAQVRVVTIEGEPWLVASDIARALDYRDAHNLTRGLDSDEKGTQVVSTPSGDQEMTVISESGFYTAALRSRAERAADFRRWVTRTVLPSIRKTGGYQSAPALTDDEIVAQALAITTHRVKELESVVEELTPDANAWRKLADSDGNYGVADAAKILTQDPAINIGRNRLFDFMADKKWIYRHGGRRGGWCAYQSQVDLGRLHERPATPFLNRKTGEYELPAPTIRVTAKGLAELHRLLATSSEMAVAS